MRKYCDGEEIDLKIFMYVHIFSTPEKWLLEYSLSVWMCPFVAPERLDGFYSYLMFMSFPNISQCLVSMNILLARWFAEPISSTLKMEAICSSETSVETQGTTRRHIPEDYTLH
jgi:hypothetical protein